MVANVIVIPLTGWLQGRFGMRASFVVSVIVFTVGSGLCGVAWDLPSLVAFRALQGIGGGAVIPTAQALLLARYPRREHRLATALYSMGAVIGPLLGPTLGGYLIEYSSWHWVFLINLPVGVLAAVLGARHIEEPVRESPPPVDVPGIVLLAVGIGSLQYVLEEGNRHGWFSSWWMSILLALSLVSLVTFVVHQLETKDPIVDLRIFEDKSYAAATVINFMVGVALFGGSYLFALYCGVVVRYSALDIGRVFLLAGCVLMLGMPLVSVLARRIDARILIVLGIGIVACSLYMSAGLTDQNDFWSIARVRMVQGVGLSLVFVPLSLVGLSEISADKRGTGTGLFNLTRELGGSFATGWMGWYMTSSIRANETRLASNVDAYSTAAAEQIAGIERLGPETWDRALSARAIIQLRVELQAVVRAFNQAFTVIALAFLATVVALIFLRPTRETAGPGAGN
jgi:DHA2 family multidrug resistance protein